MFIYYVNALMDLWYTVEPQIQWSYFYFTIVIIAVNVYFKSFTMRASWQNPQQKFLYGSKFACAYLIKVLFDKVSFVRFYLLFNNIADLFR